MSVSDAGNFDANDVAVTFGLQKVADAFAQRRSMLPPFAPYDEPDQDERPQMKATPFAWRDPATIPPRKWLYGRHLIRKFLSLDIAPGGLGKSSVKIVEALAMTTGC